VLPGRDEHRAHGLPAGEEAAMGTWSLQQAYDAYPRIEEEF
jgi:hypothetical protein